ncbi:MAG: SPASM domain-containing protein [Alphaproteobacteria bacterium]|nr:SPASM domain-containing protein [Alphaproteobacteria bacterium]
MNCGKCFADKYVSGNAKTMSVDQAVDAIKYLNYQHYANINPPLTGRKNRVTFMGGEPTLAKEIIERIMNGVGDNYKYIMYTNGLELPNLGLDILNRLDTVLVSLDGNPETHGKVKKEGTYDQIVQSIKYVRENTSCEVMGRMTITEEVDLYKSATELLKICDHVHWQIVNKNEFKNGRQFVDNYNAQSSKLIDFWFEQTRAGESPKIIPYMVFAEIMEKFIESHEAKPENMLDPWFADLKAGKINAETDIKKFAIDLVRQKFLDYVNRAKTYETSFKCGCGHSLEVIDMDGNIYICDEYVGQPEKVIGNIRDGGVRIQEHYKTHCEINEECKTCDFDWLCMGRCRKMLEVRSKEQRGYYCEMSRHTGNELVNGLVKLYSNRIK